MASGQAFGETQGRVAQLYTLDNGILVARVTDYAGILVSLEAPDRAGRRDHVVLGFDSVGEYVAAGGSFGALLGRTANRISGGRMVIDGTAYRLSQNENGNTLHGGVRGFNKQFWSVVDAGPAHVTLAIDSADGDQGFPGDVHAEATWRLDGDALVLSFAATTTKPTPLSLSAHPYFNLDGGAAGHCLDHEAEIFADAILETDREQLPTGALLPVEKTPFDFRRPARIGARIAEPHPQLRYGLGYDHYFVLAASGDGSPRPAVSIRSPASGCILDVLTTQPGVQLYTANKLTGTFAGRNGLLRQSAGFALEAQGFPDAPNHPDFPTTIVRPAETYRAVTIYRLRTDRG